MQPLSGESASQLQELLVSFEENLRAIEALKVNTKNKDICVRILSEKLDQDSRRSQELDYPGKKLQALQQLRDFITKALEASSLVATTREVNQTANCNKFGRNQKLE